MRALEIYESQLGSDDPNIAKTKNNLVRPSVERTLMPFVVKIDDDRLFRCLLCLCVVAVGVSRSLGFGFPLCSCCVSFFYTFAILCVQKSLSRNRTAIPAVQTHMSTLEIKEKACQSRQQG